jgi:hypoxanthine-guanine phosphoribosyltransferase
VLVDESSEVVLIDSEDDVAVDISTRFGRVEGRVKFLVGRGLEAERAFR